MTIAKFQRELGAMGYKFQFVTLAGFHALNTSGAITLPVSMRAVGITFSVSLKNFVTKVREDKERESRDGFDGTWVAHPDLVAVAKAPFDKLLGRKPHQKEQRREEVRVAAKDLLNFNIPGGQITESGWRNNINVAIQYS